MLKSNVQFVRNASVLTPEAARRQIIELGMGFIFSVNYGVIRALRAKYLHLKPGLRWHTPCLARQFFV